MLNYLSKKDETFYILYIDYWDYWQQNNHEITIECVHYLIIICDQKL